MGIPRGAYAVLSAIYHDNKTKPAELAAHLGLDDAAITRYLDGIERQGLIERKPCPIDRRSTDISVTTQGRTVARLGKRGSEATNDKFTADLTETELEFFQSVATAMLAKSDSDLADF